MSERGKERWPTTTSVAIILKNTPYPSGPMDDFDDRIILVRKRNSGLYTLPSGGLEFGETLSECVMRELKEETGFDGDDLVKLPVQYKTVAVPRHSKTSIGILYFATLRIAVPVEGVPIDSYEIDVMKPFTHKGIIDFNGKNKIYKPELTIPFIENWFYMDRRVFVSQ